MRNLVHPVVTTEASGDWSHGRDWRSVTIERRINWNNPLLWARGDHLKGRPNGIRETGLRRRWDFRASFHQKLVELRQLENALAELVANCAKGQKECPMLDSLRARSSES